MRRPVRAASAPNVPALRQNRSHPRHLRARRLRDMILRAARACVGNTDRSRSLSAPREETALQAKLSCKEESVFQDFLDRFEVAAEFVQDAAGLARVAPRWRRRSPRVSPPRGLGPQVCCPPGAHSDI